jgi:hypothetical protein
MAALTSADCTSTLSIYLSIYLYLYERASPGWYSLTYAGWRVRM